MPKPPPDRLVLSVAIFGAVISLATFALGGAFRGWSAMAGATLALVNLVVLRSIVLRVVSGDIHTKLPLLALIFVKMGAFMALVFWLIAQRLVEPVTFTLGLTSLVVGLITGSMFSHRTSRTPSATPTSAGHTSES